MKLNHVALTVSDRDRSEAFYREHFGLTEVVHADDHLLILADGDGSLLALAQGEPGPLPPRTTHFGFLVASADEVLVARERFAAAGVEETEFEGRQQPIRVQVADPDGHRVEIYAY